MRELLSSSYEFPGDEIPVVHGFGAAGVAESGGGSGARKRASQILQLVEALDSYIPEPERALDQDVS